MVDWSAWGAPIIAAVGGAGAGGAIANWSASRSSNQERKRIQRRALVALYDESEFIYQALRTRSWDRRVSVPMDAFQSAKGYIAELPRSLISDTYNAARVVARFNALCALGPGGGVSDEELDKALSDVKDYVGNAYGQLGRYLQVGVHGKTN